VVTGQLDVRAAAARLPAEAPPAALATDEPGLDELAEAETAANLAKTKGGVKDPTEADMVIGMSQLGQGKAAEAAATFDGIKAANPASARVVRLWGIHAKAKARPAQ
jgi:hypothetical protein